MEKPLIYVAGALRSDIPGYISNIHKMIIMAEKIRRAGFAVFIPCLDILQGIVMGDLLFHDYFQNSFAIILRCDAIFLTPGWENSEGTKDEVDRAEQRGIPVFDNLDILINAFNMNQ